MIKIKGISMDKKLIGAFGLVSILLIAVSVLSILTMDTLRGRLPDAAGSELCG